MSSIPDIIQRIARREVESPPPAIDLRAFIPHARASAPVAPVVRSPGFSPSVVVPQHVTPPPEGGTTSGPSMRKSPVPLPFTAASRWSSPGHPSKSTPPEGGDTNASSDQVERQVLPTTADVAADGPGPIAAPGPSQGDESDVRRPGFSRPAFEDLLAQPPEGGTTNGDGGQGPSYETLFDSHDDAGGHSPPYEQGSDRLAESVTDHSRQLEQVSRDLDSSLTRLFTTQLETLDHLRQRLDEQERQWLEQQALRRALL